MQFESFVNSERCKTGKDGVATWEGLRALLIQKDVKHINPKAYIMLSLRALLIQKDVKHNTNTIRILSCLRALLIQKDVKQLTED